MMNRESALATASVARLGAANQLELVSLTAPLPGLVTGELPHICEQVFGSPSITGRPSAPANSGFSFRVSSPVDVRLPPTH